MADALAASTLAGARHLPLSALTGAVRNLESAAQLAEDEVPLFYTATLSRAAL